MTPVTTELLRLAEKARDSEGLEKFIDLPTGKLGCLFQLPRQRGKVEAGYIEDACWRWTLHLPECPPNPVTPHEAELLAAGLTPEELAERRHIEAAGVFEQIAKNNDLKPMQAVLL